MNFVPCLQYHYPFPRRREATIHTRSSANQLHSFWPCTILELVLQSWGSQKPRYVGKNMTIVQDTEWRTSNWNSIVLLLTIIAWYDAAVNAYQPRKAEVSSDIIRGVKSMATCNMSRLIICDISSRSLYWSTFIIAIHHSLERPNVSSTIQTPLFFC